MRKCDSCGKPYQESKDVFCPHCGAVAQKQCTHSSTFDSNRYDRGEIYKNNNTQYQKTTYTQGAEPHAQRTKSPYTQPQKTYKGDYQNKTPKINIPDIIKTFTSGNNKGQKPKMGGIIAFCVVIAFNLITAVLSEADSSDIFSDYDVVTEYEENADELFVMVNDATIELVDAREDSKTFTLTINSIAFDDWTPENVLDDISTGVMADAILSEDTFVEMQICNLPDKKVIDEQSLDDALAQSEYYPGEQVDGECKYEFTYNFKYDEIVYLGSGVDFYLNDGMSIYATIPFTAFSISKDGKVTYYDSYSDSETDWETVFSEIPNKWENDDLVYIDFREGE